MSNSFGRRQFLKGSGAALTLAALPGAVQAARRDPIAETTSGKVRGALVNGVEVFRGVPYAGSVSGARRFLAGGAPKRWAGIRDATVPGAPSIQPPHQAFGINEPAPAEDCLTLTVWTPASDSKRRPVMFYSHGGGFTTGSGSSVLQDGANLARLYDVVVVETNHRLGLLGYLYLDELAGEEYAGSGNRGMLDIVAGLDWVSHNIERFGGDPRNVMIFGESGGGAKTCCLFGMPAAARYFNKASIESGPTIRLSTLEVARARTARVLQELDIQPRNWRRLLEVPANDLLALQMKLSAGPGPRAFGGRRGLSMGTLGFAPMVDGTNIPHHPFDPTAPEISRDKPLIVGYNQDEFAFFGYFSKDVDMFRLDEAGLRNRLSEDLPDYESILDVYRASRPEASPTDLYIAIRSAQFAASGSIVIAERKVAQHGAPVYAYIFDYKLETVMPGTDHPLGAMHALEIPFKFDNVEGPGIGGGPNLAGTRPERIEAARNMSSLWASFARTGTPSAPGQPAWPAYTTEARSTLIINAQCKIVDDPGASERKFWEQRKDPT